MREIYRHLREWVQAKCVRLGCSANKTHFMSIVLLACFCLINLLGLIQHLAGVENE